jgi:hypothetical protein
MLHVLRCRWNLRCPTDTTGCRLARHQTCFCLCAQGVLLLALVLLLLVGFWQEPDEAFF